MIAEVYPLQRMPRRMKSFDYKIPDELVAQRGSMVKARLRGKEVWGFVRRVKEKPERGIKLQSLLEVNNTFSLREVELSFFEFIANQLAQSVSSLLHVAIPVPPKREASVKDIVSASEQSVTLPKSEAEILTRLVKRLINQRECIVQIPDLRRMAVLLAAYLTHQDNGVCVIVPTVRDARLLEQYLGSFKPIVITGEETNNERYRRYSQLRKKNNSFVIGTKVAALMVNASTTSYFVFNSSHPNHRQHDRNPRFDSRSLLWEFHERTQANIYFFDPLPRAVDMHRFPESGRLQWSTSQSVALVDMNIERQEISSCFLSSQAESRVQDLLESGQRVLFVLNRKGASSGLVCRSCSERVVCGGCNGQIKALESKMYCSSCKIETPVPRQCHYCKHTELKHLAMGVGGLAKLLEKRFPGVTVGTFSKDKTWNHDAQILICTNYFLETDHDPFSQFSFGLVVIVDADTALYSTKVDAKEKTLHNVCVWRGVALAMRADFMIQTSHVDFFSTHLADPNRLLSEELLIRQRYSLPPFTAVITIENREENGRKADIAIHTLMRKLQSVENATVTESTSKTGSPLLKVRADREVAQHLLTSFTELPDHYIIDIQGLL